MGATSDSAVADVDYTEVESMTLTISASSTDGDMTQCIDITITDDGALEGDETFNVTLTTSDPDVMLGNDQTEVTISDNDGKSLINMKHNNLCSMQR